MHSDFTGADSSPRARAPILGNSESMQEVRRLVAAAASSDCDVLITGQTGTGKAHIARAIHEQSGRTGPFLCVDGSEPAGVLDTELFGPKPPGTTLFLREVGALSMPAQEQLNRARDQRTATNGQIKGPLSTARLICSTAH